jgi:DNA invertase Pin-like site-specific DNA recombinase
MPKPPATNDKGRRRAVAKPYVTVYGCARVSTDGQSVDAQIRQLRAAVAGTVFREVASGAKTDRPQLRRLLGELAAGDVVMVTRRMGGWADTTTAHGRLMLTVLGGLAEFERELIRIRTGEGRARAKANGQSLGRKPKLTPHRQQEAIRRRDQGEAVRAIARSYNVNASTISRLTA